MPFIDGNIELKGLDLTGYDHTIVGAGAAGILLAVRLSERGRKVMLIETGDLSPTAERDALNHIEQTGKPLSNPIATRNRAVGGTTHSWGDNPCPSRRSISTSATGRGRGLANRIP